MKEEALERDVRLLRLAGTHPSVVRLERVLDYEDGTYVVLEACNGEPVHGPAVMSSLGLLLWQSCLVL